MVDKHFSHFHLFKLEISLKKFSGVDVNFPWSNPSQPSIKDGSSALSEAISLNHVEAVKVKTKSEANWKNFEKMFQKKN